MNDRDPMRDPELASALRSSADASPDDAVDWGAMERRILAAAGPRLRQRRRAPAWWQVTASWSRAAMPAALAAGLLAMVAIAEPWKRGDESAAASSLVAPQQLLRAATADDVPEALTDSLFLLTAPEELYAAAMFYGEDQ